MVGVTEVRCPRWVVRLIGTVAIWCLRRDPPPFAICLDCGAQGRTARLFYSLVPTGRSIGKPLTGVGTCIECYTTQAKERDDG